MGNRNVSVHLFQTAVILPFPIQRYLLSPDISRVHSYKGLWDLGAKNLPQEGLWCKESGGEPIKRGPKKSEKELKERT